MANNSESVDTPRELKFLCTYGPNTKIVAVNSNNITYSSMICELSTICGCANGSSISFVYQFRPKDPTLISVSNDKDLKMMIQEYLGHYQPTQEYMKLGLSAPNPPAATSGSQSSALPGSISPSKIMLENNTDVRLEFWECPGSGQPEKKLETVEPNETKETEKKKFEPRFKQTQDIATTIAIRGGKSEEFCAPKDFSNFKKFVFTLDDNSKLDVKKSR